MTHCYLRAAMLTIFCAFGSGITQAQEVHFDTDLMFFKLYNSLGYLSDSTSEYELSPRYSLSRTSATGLGARVTYFRFDYAGLDGVIPVGFNTYNLDLEGFKRLNLTDWTAVEMSGGIRYNECENNWATLQNDFCGVGGTFGLKGIAKVGCSGQVYARAKYALLMGDGSDALQSGPRFATTRTQTEIASGYEHTFCVGKALIIPRVSAEWQNYANYGNSFGIIVGPDFGLGGMGFGVGMHY
jgi:hypothetical protein